MPPERRRGVLRAYGKLGGLRGLVVYFQFVAVASGKALRLDLSDPLAVGYLLGRKSLVVLARVQPSCEQGEEAFLRRRRYTRRRGCSGWFRGDGSAQAGPGIAPSASLIRVQTFMLTTTPTISRISSWLKCSTSASWKRWNAASWSVSAARVSASV